MIYIKKLLRLDILGTTTGNCPALHALQGLLTGSGLSLQAQHLVALRTTKISESDPIDVVAWGA